jgi:hypothetical protein
VSSPWDLNNLFPPPSSDASGVGIPAINTPKLEPSINTPADGNSWQKTALLSAGLIPLVPITDTLLKTLSPVSAWQQTNTSLPNATVQQVNTFKFAIQDSSPPPLPTLQLYASSNQWLPPTQPTEISSNNRTSVKNLLNLYKASAPKATQGDGKLIVGGQGNFSSIEKGGTGGLFASDTETEGS